MSMRQVQPPLWEHTCDFCGYTTVPQADCGPMTWVYVTVSLNGGRKEKLACPRCAEDGIKFPPVKELYVPEEANLATLYVLDELAQEADKIRNST